MVEAFYQMFFLSGIMKFFIIFALAFATVWAKDLYSRSIEVPVIGNEGRIVNGKMAVPGQFYYQVGLNFKKGEDFNWCGGSIIGETWVLTASQCIYGTELATVYMGGTERAYAERAHTVLRKDMIMYPGWNFRDRISDIGLMRIPNTSETGTMGKIRLPRNNDNVYLGAKVVIAGWGHTSDTSTILSTDLLYVELEVSPDIDCFRAFGSKFYASRDICVATPKLESPCRNDYGGPLVLKGQSIQIGVFSLVPPEGCKKGYPTIFTRVGAYLDWIDYHTGIKY